ncbi:MAG: hypothetical protein Q8933_00725 [Bacteroidota bacterium]|nr:hypothetical protein [Bacteroidota bacterium]MDP4189925.1 hypothetical protein [Bacteroidota bacterium]MDP4194518.1 hypothetical protein [Bacteroidota bacterium]
MRSKLIIAAIAGSFLFAGINSSVAQEKVAKKTAVKTEKKVDLKSQKKEAPKAPKTTTKKAKADHCTDKEKASCTHECGND